MALLVLIIIISWQDIVNFTVHVAIQGEITCATIKTHIYQNVYLANEQSERDTIRDVQIRTGQYVYI